MYNAWFHALTLRGATFCWRTCKLSNTISIHAALDSMSPFPHFLKDRIVTVKEVYPNSHFKSQGQHVESQRSAWCSPCPFHISFSQFLLQLKLQCNKGVFVTQTESSYIVKAIKKNDFIETNIYGLIARNWSKQQAGKYHIQDGPAVVAWHWWLFSVDIFGRFLFSFGTQHHLGIACQLQGCLTHLKRL